MGTTRTTSRGVTTIDVSCDLDCGAAHSAPAAPRTGGDHAALRSSGWTVLRPLHARSRTTYVCPACAQRIVLLVRERSRLPAPGVPCATVQERDALASAHNRGRVCAQLQHPVALGWADAGPALLGLSEPRFYRLRPSAVAPTAKTSKTKERDRGK